MQDIKPRYKEGLLKPSKPFSIFPYYHSDSSRRTPMTMPSLPTVINQQGVADARTVC